MIKWIKWHITLWRRANETKALERRWVHYSKRAKRLGMPMTSRGHRRVWTIHAAHLLIIFDNLQCARHNLRNDMWLNDVARAEADLDQLDVVLRSWERT